jgi:hypothetical protein
MNNLNKLPLGVDFTVGGLNQLQIIHSAIAPNSLRIYSANFLQCMNVNNECFDICNTQVSPKTSPQLLYLSEDFNYLYTKLNGSK